MGLGGNGSGAGPASVRRAGGAFAYATREKVCPCTSTGVGSIASGPAQARSWQAGILSGFVSPVSGCCGQLGQG